MAISSAGQVSQLFVVLAKSAQKPKLGCAPPRPVQEETAQETKGTTRWFFSGPSVVLCSW